MFLLEEMKTAFRFGLFQRCRLKLLFFVGVLFTCVSFLLEPEKEDEKGEGAATVRHDRRAEPSFVAGDYLRGARPDNTGYCRYNQAALSGPGAHTPGGGAAGPYRVLYNVVEGEATEDSSVTYCTHATPDLLYHVSEVVRRWDGPVSLAVFAPRWDAASSLQLVDRLCRCSPRMSALSLHLVFPAQAPPLLPTTPPPRPVDCTVPPPLAEGATVRAQSGLTYPVNVLRNVARTAASTAHVLVSDVELLPSSNLTAGFVALWAHLKGSRLAGTKHVFVVPVFEVESGEEVPATKRQLLRLYSIGRAVYFHRWVCLHCQRFPGLLRWLHMKPRPHLQALLIVHREYPYHRWEPVYIGTQREPLYNEQLSWEGQQDKMTQMAEMCLMSYRFVILDGAFLVHVPGVKRRSEEKPLWRLPHQRSNARVYGLIVQDLLRKYGSGGRCRL